MKILSLFDGISCGQIALERAGIKVSEYHASEIKKEAIEVTQYNYPNTKQLGDITQLHFKEGEYDIIIGGSPCQSFSIAGKGGGFDGKSGLFYEYLRVLKEVKPKYFLLENVRMKKEWQDEITNLLKEVYPDTQVYNINSKLVSAQLRNRFYWTNIQGVEQPEDKGILLKDILESGVVDREKSRAILESESRPLKDQGRMLKRYKDTGFTTVVYVSDYAKQKILERYKDKTCTGYNYFNDQPRDEKTGTLLSGSTGRTGKSTTVVIQLNPSTESNGKQPFMQNRVYSDQGKSVCLTESQAKNTQMCDGVSIRYLTQTELERLQTLPEGYTKILTRNKAAGCIGDGWTIDVIAHIFKNIK